MATVICPRSALVALGSNLGPSKELIHLAIDLLQKHVDARIVTSSLWKTTPMDCPEGSPSFVNAAMALHANSDLDPESLLHTLLSIEAKLGRKRSGIANEPRPMDMDLIACGPHQRNSTLLTLPHPRFHLRPFVLAPLSEVAPDWILPGQEKTIQTLWSDMKESQSNLGLSRLT